MNGIKNFIIDYCQRHAHPVNAVLHIFGVPMAFYGFYDLFVGQWLQAAGCIAGGYFLQYLGHKAQGNEVGEVILIKKIWKKLTDRGNASAANARGEDTVA